MPRGTPHEPGEWPVLTRCVCGEGVLIAKRLSNGRRVLLDEWPVLIGVGRCSHCNGKGERSYPEYARNGRVRPFMGDLDGVMTHQGSMSTCHVCGGTGLLGEPFNSRTHVVMTMDGLVRPRGLGLVAPWDSAYRRHRCAALTARAA